VQPFDDARDSLRPERPPAYHDWRLGRLSRTLWRVTLIVVGILVAGGLLDLLGVIG
jgi:hypothetical protein